LTGVTVLGFDLLGVGVVVTGVEVAVDGDFDLCPTTRYAPASTTTPTSKAASRSWRVLNVAFMAFLSARPGKAGLPETRDTQTGRGTKAEGQRERARFPAPSRSCTCA
jgi:hypothetical protein